MALSEQIVSSTLPVAAVPGKSKAKVQVDITNGGNIATRGKTAVVLYAVPAGGVAGSTASGTVLATGGTSAGIKPRGSKTVTISVKTIPAIAGETYSLVVQVTDPQAHVTTATGNTTYALGTPFVSLAPSAAKLTVNGDGSGAITFTLRDAGNAASSGNGTVTVASSSTFGSPDGTAIVSETVDTTLAVGASKTVTVQLTAGEVAAEQAALYAYLNVTDAAGTEQSLLLNEGIVGPFTLAASDALKDVKVGADGSVWALGQAGQLKYDGATGAFVNLGGSLSSLEVGTAGSVWGMADGVADHLNPATNTLVAASGAELQTGKLQSITAGADGDVWGVDPLKIPYHYDSTTNAFKQVNGNFTQIAVGSDGEIYGLGVNGGGVYWYNPSVGFQTLGHGTLTAPTSLSVGADGAVIAWGNGTAYWYNVLNDTFEAIGGDNVTTVVDGAGPYVYALDYAGNLLHLNGNTMNWVETDALLSTLAVGTNGAVWGLDHNARALILQNAPTTEYHTLEQVGGSVDQISVGADGGVWGVSNDTVKFFDFFTQQFVTVPNSPVLSQVSAGARGDVWGVHVSDSGTADASVYKYDAVSQTWQSLAGQENVVQVSAEGAAVFLNAGGMLSYYSPLASGTAMLTLTSEQLGEVSVGADQSIWGLDDQLSVHHFENPADVLVPGSLAQISVGSASEVWGVTVQGAVEHFDADAGRFVTVSGVSLVQVWATFDGVVGVTADGTLERYDPAAGAFHVMGSGILEVVAGNDEALWGRNPESGAVYRLTA